MVVRVMWGLLFVWVLVLRLRVWLELDLFAGDCLRGFDCWVLVAVLGWVP